MAMKFDRVDIEINQADPMLSTLLGNAKKKAKAALRDLTQEEQEQYALLDQ